MQRFNLKFAVLLGLALCAVRGAQPAQLDNAPTKTIFRVKYVSEGVVYLDSGHNAGLEEGMVLHAVHADPNGGTTEAIRFQDKEPVGDLRIFSVADSSAAAEVVKSKEDLVPGDLVYLDPESIHLRDEKKNVEDSTNYPVVVTFSYGDPLDEEVRETAVPQNHVHVGDNIRGRIGIDFGNISQPGGIASRQVGFMLQSDMTRIGGTYWNFTGYWRGRLNTQSTGSFTGTSPTTLTDLVNRTYHLGLFYQNPDALVTLGVGRLYLPYAPSLSTIDGGYVGLRITRRLTVGAFGGSTPDPTSWSYSQNQHIAGTFINYERGSYEHSRFSDTAGLAMTSMQWHVAREFVFLENTVSVGRKFSAYNSLQADAARVTPSGAIYTTGLTQSFSTIRFQPITLLTFNLNHNYLLNLPTFDPSLISTGLLDQFLFQGLSGGVRIELPHRVAFSTDLGRSKGSTDAAPSWNQMFDATFGDILKSGLTLDTRYTKFNSSFGRGTYEYVSLSKNLSDTLRLQMQGGIQHLTSNLSANSDSKFLTGLVDWSLGPRYFMEGMYTYNTGTALNYTQMNFTFGYRFGGFRKK